MEGCFGHGKMRGEGFMSCQEGFPTITLSLEAGSGDL